MFSPSSSHGSPFVGALDPDLLNSPKSESSFAIGSQTSFAANPVVKDVIGASMMKEANRRRRQRVYLGVPTDQITEAVLGAFVHHLASCSCPHAFQGRDRSHQEGGQLFVTHLRAVGVLSLPTSAVESVPPVLEQFSAWMRYHRGVRVSTLGNYLPSVARPNPYA